MTLDPPDLDRIARALGADARADHPLGALTTYRVWGTAALFVEADGEDGLVAIAAGIEGVDVPVLVLGRGSNLLVADRGFPGLVVSLGATFDTLSIDGNEVRAGAALSLPVLARRTVAAGLHGLEWAVGVPGSVGGAVCMNAGGHGSETSATLVRCRWVSLRSGVVHEVPAEQLRAGYRHTDLGPADVVMECVHHLEPGDPGEGAATIAGIVQWRRANQPGGPNAGSVFTNPPGDSAGRIIEGCGLKGVRIGSAEISPKHANFIQADRGGSADDVRRLIDHVQAVVARSTGVDLATEVRMVGFTDEGTGVA